MKKFYLLLTPLLLGLAGTAVAQYTATNSGNWSNPVTWAPGGIPSAICNNCVVTISANVIVQLDQHVELQGNSVLYIGSDATNPAQIVIGNSSQTTINTGYNIIMDTLPGNSKVYLYNKNAKIVATSAGIYDGIFSESLNGSPYYTKEVGNSPSGFKVDNSIGNTAPPGYGQVLSGPVTLFAGGTLPVTLVDFNVILHNNTASLTWTTEQETNSYHFSIQRSVDGVHWLTVGMVAAHGVSSIPLNYSYTDASVSVGVNYYRVEAVNTDGKYMYSEIKIVRGSAISGLKVFPNPAKSYVNITLGNNISSNQLLRLIDQYGKVLQEKQLTNAAGTTVSLPVSNYMQGIYLLQIKAADGSQQSFPVFISH
jgi:type IX secretion system substrate protein